MKKKFLKLNDKIDEFVDLLIPTIIIMIPLIFILYILNVHGYLPFIGKQLYFHLASFYRYLFYILSSIYLYKVIIGKAKITKSDVFLFLFMFFTILSTIFAYNHNVALYGYPNRYEGMFTLLFYCFLYLDSKFILDKKEINHYIKIILGFSILHFIVVILQMSGLYQKVIYMYTSNNRIGLTENSNFLGSLMCFFSMLSLSSYYLKEKKGYYLFIFIISYTTLLLANTTGPFLSFIFTFIIFIIYLIKKKKFSLKEFFISLILIITIYPIALYPKDYITKDIKSTCITLSNISKKYILGRDIDLGSKEKNNEKISNLEIRNMGSGRIRIWINVLKSVKKRPLLGYGPDNLGLVYETSADDSMIADKAHNIYLHILVSSGIFALISYILWIYSCLSLGFKNGKIDIIIMCFGIIAYLVQGFFNINVLEVTSYFYIIMGFMMLLIDEKNIKQRPLVS